MKKNKIDIVSEKTGKIIQTTTLLKNNKIDISFFCEKCGKPLTKTNKYGMFCEDLCYYKESKLAEKKISGFIANFEKLFENGNRKNNI